MQRGEVRSLPCVGETVFSKGFLTTKQSVRVLPKVDATHTQCSSAGNCERHHEDNKPIQEPNMGPARSQAQQEKTGRNFDDRDAYHDTDHMDLADFEQLPI